MTLTKQNRGLAFPHNEVTQNNNGLTTKENLLDPLHSNADVQTWITEIEAGAALKERGRLAQELHDNVAQSLGYLNLQISALDSIMANGRLAEARTNLKELKQLARAAYTDVREEIFNLRGKVPRESDFWDTLRKNITKKFYGLNIQLDIEMEPTQLEFPTEVGQELLHIIQEALINIRKHAGVDQAVIRFSRKKGHICVVIADNGNGFNLDQIERTNGAGFGSQIMHERAERIGGNLNINSTPGGGGTRVVIRL